MNEPAAAPAILTIDVAALADNWRLLARRAAPGDCAAVVKANGYGLGIEAVAPPLYAAGCRAFFVAQISEGKSLRALLPQADARIYRPQRAGGEGRPARRLFRLPPRAGDRRRGRARTLGRVRARAGRAAGGGAAPRHRHEPARLRIARSLTRRGRRGGRERRRYADEPFRLLGTAGRSAQRAADRAFRGGARGVSGAEDVARQFLRPVPARAARLRSRAAGLRALRRQPDAGTAEPDEAGRGPRRRDPADALDREGRDLRLQRTMEGAAAHAARHSARRLRRRPAARRRRGRGPRRGRGRDRRPPLPAGRPRCRWT